MSSRLVWWCCPAISPPSRPAPLLLTGEDAAKSQETRRSQSDFEICTILSFVRTATTDRTISAIEQRKMFKKSKSQVLVDYASEEDDMSWHHLHSYKVSLYLQKANPSKSFLEHG